MLSDGTIGTINNRNLTLRSGSWALEFALLITVFAVSAQPVHAQTESILYNFACCDPRTNLAIDNDGNLYGTTAFFDGGTVYKVTPSGSYTLLPIPAE